MGTHWIWLCPEHPNAFRFGMRVDETSISTSTSNGFWIAWMESFRKPSFNLLGWKAYVEA